MKKKIIIPIGIVALFLVIGFIIFDNNKIVSTITLDINPSVQINLTKNKKVKNVMGLNDDAKEIVTKEYNNKSLDEAFELLITKLIDKGYTKDKNIDVIVYAEGDISSEDVASKVEFNFGKEDIHTEVIVINTISAEDKKLAEKYDISPAKMVYIKSITKEYENINVEEIINKPVSELMETKETGKYCETDYMLEGDWCLKEKERVSAIRGEVCPAGYTEENGKCYEETNSNDEEYCEGNGVLKDGKCIGTVSQNAQPIYSCSTGELQKKGDMGFTAKEAGDANDLICIDLSNATHPVSPCDTNDGTEYIVYGGKCYWHRAPVIESGCPGKIQIGGFCWDDASNIYICEGFRDGERYSSPNGFCPGTTKYTLPNITGYKCEDEDAVLNGTKCTKEEIKPAFHKTSCPKGFTMNNENKCINYNNSVSMENGLVCENENSRLEGNMCVIYEVIEAKFN